MTAHALLSASKAVQWINCPGSIALGKDIPDTWSTFAEEGTVAHEVASWCLGSGREPKEFEGEMVRIINGKYMSPMDILNAQMYGDKQPFIIQTDNLYEVTPDMIGHIESYVQAVEDFTPPGAKRFIEERVDFSRAIGVPDSFGTSDVIIIHKDEICVIDLKYGMGVEVSAYNNPQLMLYALGALERYKLVYDFKRVRMVIHQPRIQNLSEWDCSVEELMAFGRSTKQAAWSATHSAETPEELMKNNSLRPSEKACRFCKSKGICPALAKKSLETIAEHFVNLDEPENITVAVAAAVDRLPAATTSRLSHAMKAIDMVEIWSKGVREAVFSHLARGEPVDGFKIVRGRQGNRKWSVDKDAEKKLKSFKLKTDQMYNKKLISPTDAEKLLSKLAPEKWEDLQTIITRSEGSLSVAPMDDKRPAEAMADLGFETIGEE